MIRTNGFCHCWRLTVYIHLDHDLEDLAFRGIHAETAHERGQLLGADRPVAVFIKHPKRLAEFCKIEQKFAVELDRKPCQILRISTPFPIRIDIHLHDVDS